MHFNARPIDDRLLSKLIDTAEGCWQWTASTRDGYGQIRDGRSVRQAHLVAYELLVGPVDDELELDHVCRNRLCCNPDHLEPVTHQENLRRGHLARAA